VTLVRRKPLSRIWTAEEEEKLRALIAAGKSAVSVAVNLDRPVGSTRRRAKTLGLNFPRMTGRKPET